MQLLLLSFLLSQQVFSVLKGLIACTGCSLFLLVFFVFFPSGQIFSVPKGVDVLHMMQLFFFSLEHIYNLLVLDLTCFYFLIFFSRDENSRSASKDKMVKVNVCNVKAGFTQKAWQK